MAVPSRGDAAGRATKRANPGSIDQAPKERVLELSVLPRPQEQNAQAVAEERCPLALFDVPVPDELRQFGESVRASAWGDAGNQPVVVLGGISADCFPGLRPDGSLG